MKVLITGCNGFLGSNLIKELSSLNYDLIGANLNKKENIEGIDFKQGNLLDMEFTKSLIKSYNPDIIINTVALVDVDRCEESPEDAYKLNVLTAKNISEAIERKEVKLIHISSDQLFDGLKSFYSEKDVPKPLNIYGKTKAEAEKVCLGNHENTIVVRTNFFGWSPKGHKPTFAEWVFNSLKEKIKINMFTDVFFTPINVSILVRAIEKIFQSEYKGILNIAGKSRVSKYDFGIKLAEKFGFDSSLITPTSVSKFPFKAPRQPDMSLSVEKYEKLLNYKLPDLDESLNKFADSQNEKWKL